MDSFCGVTTEKANTRARWLNWEVIGWLLLKRGITTMGYEVRIRSCEMLCVGRLCTPRRKNCSWADRAVGETGRVVYDGSSGKGILGRCEIGSNRSWHMVLKGTKHIYKIFLNCFAET